MIEIRPIDEGDWPAAWRIIEPVFRAGDTYGFPPEITERDARRIWVELPAATFVCVDDSGEIVGSYYIKPNQSGPGGHVCNCGYIVAERARGQGIASAMCRHSQTEAVARGFLAMQYNFVASTNESAIRVWKKHGFEVAGRLPKAFRHPGLGLVDAFVMYKLLDDSG